VLAAFRRIILKHTTSDDVFGESSSYQFPDGRGAAIGSASLPPGFRSASDERLRSTGDGTALASTYPNSMEVSVKPHEIKIDQTSPP
jgi:hypothetical protein